MGRPNLVPPEVSADVASYMRSYMDFCQSRNADIVTSRGASRICS